MKYLYFPLLLLNTLTIANHFKFGVKMIPHPDKIKKGGEDAYYLNNHLLSVADGVGSWSLRGIDPGKYSKEVCSKLGILWNQHSDTYKTNLKQLIIDTASISKNPGSSTLVILSLDRSEPIMYASYIGDSSYAIYRRAENVVSLVLQSEEQQHRFNFPFQIGSVGDNPATSLEFQHVVQHNDIIVLGSDGLFDNINGEEIGRFIQSYLTEHLIDEDTMSHQFLASQLAQKAYMLSLDKIYDSPFAQRARAVGIQFMGGKSDDITVVVATIIIDNI